MGKILTKDRIKKIEFLQRQIRKAINEMIKTETNPTIKAAYEKTLDNLNLPTNFYPKDSLMRTVFKIGKHFISSEILGEHKQNLKIVREGNLVKVIPQGEIIEMPIDLLFYGGGDKLTWKGVHTYIHEASHAPLRDAPELQKLGLNHTQREELIADLLSARIAVKMGYPRERIFELYKGRQSVYGGFPFNKALEKAVTPKKRRGPGKFHWEAPRKIKRKGKKQKTGMPKIIDITKRKEPFYRRAA